MELIKELKILQRIRGRVPMFLYFGDIKPQNLVSTRKQLFEAPIEKEIDVILHSPGGSPADAYRLIRVFRERYNIVNIIVPFWAKSAATLFALGGSRLVLGEFGELGPIDPQIKKDDENDPSGGWVPALNVQSSLSQIEERAKQQVLETFTKLRSLEEGNTEITKIGRRQLAEILFEYASKFYAPLLSKIEAIELGTMARYLDIGRMYAKRILKQYTKTEQNKVEALLDFLVYECPDHGYVIDYQILKQYLPHIQKTNEAPFGEDYSKTVEKISIFLMESEVPNFVGFLDNLDEKIDPVSTRRLKTKKKEKIKKNAKQRDLHK